MFLKLWRIGSLTVMTEFFIVPNKLCQTYSRSAFMSGWDGLCTELKTFWENVEGDPSKNNSSNDGQVENGSGVAGSIAARGANACSPHHDSSSACHLHTCCPFDSFISVQWLSSSSPELFRPREIQPIISFLFMLRLLYTDRIRVTSESWNRATWKTKVSLYTGFGCPLRMDVLHLDISWPMEFSRVNLTYVSVGKKKTHRTTYHKYHWKQTQKNIFLVTFAEKITCAL